MRTDQGWYVLDFEGEPSRPLEERQRPHLGAERRSRDAALAPLRLPQFALGERAESDPALLQLAQAWEDRNRSAFLRGYKDCKGIEDLLPPEAARPGSGPGGVRGGQGAVRAGL